MCSDPILVWDNEVDHLDLLLYNLSKAGYSVVAAPSEEAVVSTALVQSPSLIILGNCSSEPQRAEICRALKAQAPLFQIPILCLTTDDHCWERDYNQNSGMSSCIIFPAKPKQILKEVKALISGNVTPCCPPAEVQPQSRIIFSKS